MRRRFFVVQNPGAGVAGSPLVEDVARLLANSGGEVTRARADIAAAQLAVREAAQSGNYDAIVAAGGDGTIRNAAGALIATDMPLGIIPVGTGNVLAHEIGLVRTPPAIARMLLEGPIARVACAQANGEPFLLMVGAGFDARVVAALDQRLKSRLGKVAYAGPLLGAIMRPIDTLLVTVDGRHHVATWAVIANARHYGGRFVLAPRTGILERGLEAILFKTRQGCPLFPPDEPGDRSTLPPGSRWRRGRNAALLTGHCYGPPPSAHPDRWRCIGHNTHRDRRGHQRAPPYRARRLTSQHQPGSLTFR